MTSPEEIPTGRFSLSSSFLFPMPTGQHHEDDSPACEACDLSSDSPPLVSAPEPCPSLFTLPPNGDGCPECHNQDDSSDDPAPVEGTPWAEGETCNCAFGTLYTTTPVARLGGAGWEIPEDMTHLLPSTLYQVFQSAAGPNDAETESGGCHLPGPEDSLVPVEPAGSLRHATYQAPSGRSFFPQQPDFDALTPYPQKMDGDGRSDYAASIRMPSISLEQAKTALQQEILNGNYHTNAGFALDASIPPQTLFSGSIPVEPVFDGAGAPFPLQRSVGCTLDALHETLGSLWKEKDAAGAGEDEEDASSQDDSSLPCQACDGVLQQPAPSATAPPPPKQYEFTPPAASSDPEACSSCPTVAQSLFDALLPMLSGPQVQAVQDAQVQASRMQLCASSD